ncbi:MAG: hypothetical protein ABR571_17285 [Jatrophihabitans sp.]|uniref:hypothetical protein n=1 Tax=Jatrophihabitans sp. TaxID=1932789 RepID=UPI0039103222
MALRSRKLVVAVVATAAVVIAGAIWLPKLWETAKDQMTPDTCTIGAYELDPEQAVVAAAMVGAVTRYRIELPERAAVLALAAGLQESKLRNLAPGEGDRDSVGVLQQRPSQGWGRGNAATLNDVGEATKEFLDHLVRVDKWQTLSLADAVQRVQISADGGAYAQHEIEAQTLADALSGRKPADISCSFAKPTKVASGTKVASQVKQELGVRTPQVTGLTVTVPGARWQTVAWFVANAERLGIEEVRYDGKVWSRTGGWKSSEDSAGAVTATLFDLKAKK